MGNSESSIKQNLEGRPVVVVVGGGYAGTAVAKALDKHFNVLLIERKKYFFHNIGALRATVDSDFVPNIAIPYTKMLKFGYVVHAEVEEITKTGIRVKGRQDLISFDYCVVALGTSYAFPSKVALADPKGLVPLYQEVHQAIEAASNIAIIGAGPVGIELTGELTHKHPNKKITLIHSHSSLSLGKTSNEFNEDLQKKIRALPNVNMILGERVKIDDISDIQFSRFAAGNRQLVTDKGTTVDTDLVFFCGGSKVNNSAMKNGELASKLDENGRLKVNKFLQIEGYENIFAIGDCANVPEGKLAFASGLQAQHAATNINLLDAKKELKEYKNLHPGMFVTLGPKMGAGQLPTASGTILGNTIVSFLKGGDMFASKAWGDLNLKMPKSGAKVFDDSSDDNNSKEAKDKRIKELSRMSSFMKITDQDAKKLVEGFVAENSVDVDHT